MGTTNSTRELEWLDHLVIGMYFVLVFAVALGANLQRRAVAGVKGYFLAGRELLWLPIGCSLFASSIGAENLIGLTGAGVTSGLLMTFYEWNTVILVILLGWVFLPIYLSAGVYTLPEYMEKRFGPSYLRVYLSGVCLFLYFVTKISACVYACGLFVSVLWPKSELSLYGVIVILFAVTAVFTLLGGLTGVVYMDTLQTLVILIGTTILVVFGLKEVGGVEGLMEKYPKAYVDAPESYKENCSRPEAEAFHLFRSPVKKVVANKNNGGEWVPPFVLSESGWPGVFLQSSLGCLWYWCTDQVMVQRLLAARSLSHARAGCLLAGALKLLPIWVVLLGMVARVLYTAKVACVGEACVNMCDSKFGCSNRAYPELVLELLPRGLKGLQLAAALAALMSSLTSILNSSCAIFTCDLWVHFRRQWTRGMRLARRCGGQLRDQMGTLCRRLDPTIGHTRTDSEPVPLPEAFTQSPLPLANGAGQTALDAEAFNEVKVGELEMLIVGRLFIIVICVLSLIWIPVMHDLQSGQLFSYLQAFQSYLGTPIGALFTVCIFSHRITLIGAAAGIGCGHLLGISRLVLEVSRKPPCGTPDYRDAWLRYGVDGFLHYSYFGTFSFLFTAGVVLIISRFTRPPTIDQFEGLTWSTRKAWKTEQLGCHPANSSMSESKQQLGVAGGSVVTVSQCVPMVTESELMLPSSFTAPTECVPPSQTTQTTPQKATTASAPVSPQTASKEAIYACDILPLDVARKAGLLESSLRAPVASCEVSPKRESAFFEKHESANFNETPLKATVTSNNESNPSKEPTYENESEDAIQQQSSKAAPAVGEPVELLTAIVSPAFESEATRELPDLDICRYSFWSRVRAMTHSRLFRALCCIQLSSENSGTTQEAEAKMERVAAILEQSPLARRALDWTAIALFGLLVILYFVFK